MFARIKTMEITALISGIGALKHAADIARLIKESGATLEQSEIKLKFAELIDNIAEAKLSMAALKDEIEQRDSIINKLEKAIELRNQLKFDGQFYQEEGDSVPFCPRCFEVDVRPIHLTKEVADGWHIVRKCPQCSQQFHIRDIPFNLG